MHLHAHTCLFRGEKERQQGLRDESQMKGRRQTLLPGTQGQEGRVWQNPSWFWRYLVALESKLNCGVPYILRNCEEVLVWSDWSMAWAPGALIGTWQGLVWSCEHVSMRVM